jgi:hypothetical protein
MPVDVAGYIKVYGTREFYMKPEKEQNQILYDHFPTVKGSTLRMAKRRFKQKLDQKSVTQPVTKKKTVTPGDTKPQNHKVHNSPSLSTSPPSTPVNAGVDTSLSPYIREVMNIQTAFVGNKLQCNVTDAMKLRAAAMQFDGMEDIPAWNYPPKIADNKGKSLYHPKTYEKIISNTDWKDKNGKCIVKFTGDQWVPDDSADFYSGCLPPHLEEKRKETHAINKQMLIIQLINNPLVEILAVEAAKRHGKSTSGKVGVDLGVWNGYFKKIGLWASGEDNAIGILEDTFNDMISANQTMPLFKGVGSRTKKVYFNNSTIQAFGNNAAHTSGLDFDLCWIDEAHEVVVEHKDVFTMIIMTMRAKPTIKLLITMNKGTGTYHIFKDTLEKEFGKETVFLTIEDEDIVHVTEKADKKVRALTKAVSGKKAVDRWLNNKTVNTSTFDPMSVIYAYDNYDLFLSTHKPTPAYTVASYDPSGTGHPMGYSIWSCDITGSYFWQRFGIEYELGERPEEWGHGEKLGPLQIQTDMFEKAHHYHITHFISESNMDGKIRMIEFRSKGYEAENQNFGNDKNKDGTPSRGAMCHIVRRIMDNQALFICTERLRGQWSIYNPDEHEKVAKFKGDEADSGIHAIYYLCVLTDSAYLSQENYEMEWV